MSAVTFDDIRKAHDLIQPFIHRTPVLTSTLMNEAAGAKLFFKCENLQKVGAFKARGAHHAVFSLDDEHAQRGVVTHSSGNHAAALALAARRRGIKAWIVMPRTAPEIKKKAVQSYGGEIILCEPTQTAREETARQVIDRTGAMLIHAYDNPRIIAGQGTAAVELLDDVPDLDVVITPVGGGGLTAGTSIAVKAKSPQTEMIAAEPAGAADAYRSFTEGRIVPSVNPQTICDGLLTSLGSLPFAIIRHHVDRIITVDDETIMAAMRFTWERMKIIIEPSAAVPLAVVLANKSQFINQRIGLILSGGNVDLTRLPWLP